MLLLHIILRAIFPSLKTEIQLTKKQSSLKKKYLVENFGFLLKLWTEHSPHA